MAGGEFKLNPWELQGEGREFESLAEEFGKATDSLSKGLEALKEPWGDDDIGQYFGTVYTGARDGIVDSMNHLAEQLGKIGGGLQSMAASAAQTDDEVGTGMDRLDSRQQEITERIGRLDRPRL